MKIPILNRYSLKSFELNLLDEQMEKYRCRDNLILIPNQYTVIICTLYSYAKL